MAKNSISNFIKIVGLLGFLGTVLAKLMPLFSNQHPRLRKKIDHIGSLLAELKDEIVDLASTSEVKKVVKAVKKKK